MSSLLAVSRRTSMTQYPSSTRITSPIRKVKSTLTVGRTWGELYLRQVHEAKGVQHGVTRGQIIGNVDWLVGTWLDVHSAHDTRFTPISLVWTRRPKDSVASSENPKSSIWRCSAFSVSNFLLPNASFLPCKMAKTFGITSLLGAW